MTFVHPVLLAGLLLVGIPVLIHLIMRQQPKHLLFPAVRFLMQRHRTNQRKLQLRHLLLLLLRMGLIALVCLALARPKVFSDRLNTGAPVAAVLVFDTSPSMEYKVAGKSRLDEARRLGQELLDELPPGSQVALLDTAEAGEGWLPTLSYARERLGQLRIRPANYPVTSQLSRAYDLLMEKLGEGQASPGEGMLPFVYVFSDRTQASWDAAQAETLKRLRDRLPPPGVQAAFVDVGVDKPEDLAVANVELPRQVVTAEGKVELRVTVRATGRDYDTEVICGLDGDRTLRKPVQLESGQSRVLTFEDRRLAPGPHQVEITLPAKDASLEANDRRFATFEVRGHRRVLTLTDDPAAARIWTLALETRGAFQCAVKSGRDAGDLSPAELSQYEAVCLLNLARPSHDLWEKLEVYVRKGGGLAVIPGGGEMEAADSKAAYNDDPAARALLPARLKGLVTADGDPGAVWSGAGFKHPVMAPFREWGQSEQVDFFRPGLEPAAARYWEVEPYPNEAYVVVSYADKERRPALLERLFDRRQAPGRVLLFTTPLDDEHAAPRGNRPRWHNYLQTSFYLVLAQNTVGYLAGDAEDSSFNFQSGQSVTVPLPTTPRFPTYTIQGPDLSGSEAIVPRAEAQNELVITRAVTPGNYKVVGADSKVAGSFSLNLPPDETLLTRVPAEQIEDLFGPGSVLPLDYRSSLAEALQKRWSRPVELYPWLLILLLLALAVENLLANKFYRREPAGEATAPVPASKE